jgi:L-fuculose-phosphate aldolase
MRRSLKIQDPVEQLLAAARTTADMNLNYVSTGNVSVCTDHGIYVSRTGSRCGTLSAGDLVLITPDGKAAGGTPSIEWPFHEAIYHARPDVRAIVHCHSPAASIVALAQVSIPTSFHYMAFAHTQGVIGEIKCAPYEVPGSEALARETVKALGRANACLLGGHGQVAVGATVQAALDNAVMFEQLCFMFASLHPELKPVPIPEDKIEQTARLFRKKA